LVNYSLYVDKYFFFSFFLSFLVHAVNAGNFRVPSGPTLPQKLGQMLLLGFRGTEATDQSHIVRDILSQEIGGIILFDEDKPSKTSLRNIVSYQQVNRLISKLQSYSKIPLLVAIDQEGGLVSRNLHTSAALKVRFVM